MAIHKSQGGTFDTVVYDYAKAHPQKLVYVALSRVTTIQGVYLANLHQDHTFYHHLSNADNALVSEYERINKHGLDTAYARCRAHPATVYTVDLLNVRSLICHMADVRGDRLSTTADVLLFTEVIVATRSQAVTIPELSMVAYASRVDAARSSGACIYVRNGIAASELPNVAVPTGEACAVQLDESGMVIEAIRVDFNFTGNIIRQSVDNGDITVALVFIRKNVVRTRWGQKHNIGYFCRIVGENHFHRFLQLFLFRA
ncbi:hypothetical protein HPB52_000679 [Rhipicephalus sanguineus]|uniref:UvrD-like helicase C-terminal domain-containing protein n=1 Tax=Rhipicephalus sanguineus TaxID=34632 RepID=A0A9D4QG15_RHISA|nr:hypothetical protein HPB52_000679 [Rhipicephalus sanguineus]